MRECSIRHCERPHYAKGFCRLHRERQRYGYDMTMPIQEARDGCDIEGCVRPHEARGLCRLHYQRSRLGISMDRPIQRQVSRDGLCHTPGCENPIRARLLCVRHYSRYLRRRKAAKIRAAEEARAHE
jgi:hypothetical protein